MAKENILAVCDHARDARILAQLVVIDGQPAIEFWEGSPARQKGTEKHKQISIQSGVKRTVSLDSDDARISGAFAFCRAHNRSYFLSFPELVEAWHAGRTPITLRPAKL